MQHHPLMRLSFLVLVFLTLAVPAHAQAPGYIGKKLSVGYGLNVSPCFTRANLDSSFINSVHAFGIDYVTGTHWQVGVEARYYNTIYRNSKYSLSNNEGIPANYYKIKGFGAAVLFKHFKRRYVAPWGNYFMFGPTLNLTQSEYDNYMYFRQRLSNRDTLISNFGDNIQWQAEPDFVFGWGHSRILYDRLIIDYGLIFQLRALIATISDPIRMSFYGSGLTRTAYIPETSRIRMHGMNRANVYLKVAYLF